MKASKKDENKGNESVHDRLFNSFLSKKAESDVSPFYSNNSMHMFTVDYL